MMILLLFFSLTTTPPEDPQLLVDVPWQIEAAHSTTMRVSFVGTSTIERTHVVADRSSTVIYDPEEFDITPDRNRNIQVTVRRTPSGLAELRLDPECCDQTALTVTTGFTPRLRWRSPESLESNTTRAVMLEFIDAQDRPGPLDAPVQLRVVPSNALIRTGTGTWTDHLDFDLPMGASLCPVFQIMSTSRDTARGLLQVTGYVNDHTYVLFNSNFDFEITPPATLRFAACIAGALLYSLYENTKRRSRRWWWPLVRAVTTSFVAGVLAYAATNLNLLGIRVDLSRLTGFLLAGFLMSYAGVEPLLERLLPKHREGTPRDHSEEPETLSSTPLPEPP